MADPRPKLSLTPPADEAPVLDKGGAPPEVLEPAAPAEMPTKVRLQTRHGYIEEETGRPRMWEAGDVIVDAGEIALLLDRHAPLDILA